MAEGRSVAVLASGHRAGKLVQMRAASASMALGTVVELDLAGDVHRPGQDAAPD